MNFVVNIEPEILQALRAYCMQILQNFNYGCFHLPMFEQDQKTPSYWSNFTQTVKSQASQWTRKRLYPKDCFLCVASSKISNDYKKWIGEKSGYALVIPIQNYSTGMNKSEANTSFFSQIEKWEFEGNRIDLVFLFSTTHRLLNF